MADPPRKRYKLYLSQKSPLESVPRSSRHALQKRIKKNCSLKNLQITLDLNESTVSNDEVSSSEPASNASECDDEQDQNEYFFDVENEDVVGAENYVSTQTDAPADINRENVSDSETESFADEDWREDIDVVEADDGLAAIQQTKDQSTGNQREHYAEDQPLYDGAPITVGSSMLLLMTFVMKHSLSGAALSDLLDLISAHCKVPNQCARSVYQYKAFFRDLTTPLRFHYYCKFCNGLLEGSEVAVCPYCEKALPRDEILKKSYFIEVPTELQLQEFFQRNGFFDDIGYRFTRKKKNLSNIEDVQDGSEYQQYFTVGGLLQQQSNVALQFNTDGVAIFKSSAFKIWPVYLEILDLPPNKR